MIWKLTLATLTLEGPLLGAFERLIECFAKLVMGKGNLNTLATESEDLKLKLLAARFPNRMWEAARSMVDESTSHAWSTFLKADPLAELGMKGPPKHVIVGLLVGKQADNDPVADTLARAAFQRACVTLHGSTATS